MPDTENDSTQTRKARNLEDEIARQEARLRKLQNDLKERKRREQERNAKAISALLQAERLDTVPVEKWQSTVPALKSLLLKDEGSPGPVGGGEGAAMNEKPSSATTVLNGAERGAAAPIVKLSPPASSNSEGPRNTTPG